MNSTRIKVSDEIIQEGKNVIDGVYYPLKGFLNEADLKSVLETMRLSNGKVWPMPIILDVNKETADEIRDEKEVVITNGKEEIILSDISIYPYDKNYLAKNLFGTEDINHPGVEKIMKMGDYLIGGVVRMDKKVKPHGLYLTPDEVKEVFRKNKWANVVAFQTRNPPHRSHEHLQKTALKNVDGIFINPVIGPKKSGDFHDDHILGAYEVLIDKYYPENSALLGTFHTHMRYAGPKEAVFHALVRRNFGCTHMIIGRDHAGVGDYYGTYDAQNIFDGFTNDELGIKILKYENVSFCKECRDMMQENECDHGDEHRIHLSGTKLREKLTANEDIPEEFMRKEVIEYLINNKDNLFV